MLLTKEVEVRLGARNIKYYEDLGYEIPRIVGPNGNLIVDRSTPIIVKTEDLPPYARTIIDVLCDNCKINVSHIPYSVYTDCSPDGIHFCKQCANVKREQTCMDRYGVVNVFQDPDVKLKSKETSIEKYGVEYPCQTTEVQNKIKQTCLDRYGVEHSAQSPEVIAKIRQTCLERYGFEYVGQCDEHKKKSRQTCMDKYGVEYFFQSDIFKEKAKQTCIDKYGEDMYSKTAEGQAKMRQTMLERYGVERITQLPEMVDKIRETNLQKYGVDCALKLPEIQEKAKQTNLLRYGFEYSSQSPEVKEKVKQTSLRKYGTEWPIMSDVIRGKITMSFYLHGTTMTSSQQLGIYNMLRDHYGDDCVKLNYPCGRCSLDVVVLFDDIKIDVEYDGSFWHADQNRDRRRDEFVKIQGYRILRIKSRREIPDFADLVNKIEILRDGEHTYDEIVLPDWKTTQNDCDNNQTNTDDESLGIN